jgi:glycosyltransferase involved in cell wall biosynthesis
VLYVGHYSRQHFQRLGCSPQQLVASPYSVDTTPFAPDEVSRTTLRAATRDALGIASDQTAILFSGKLSARKGPDLLLRAVKQLPSLTRSGSMVLFLGSGDERGALEALAKEPPAVRVAFLGFQNQSQLSRYYHAADLLALPSRHSETWGLVVNEALHHGLPCVISQAVGCGPDLVEPGVTGEWCQTESASSLAAALERGLALVGRTEIRERCRLKVGAHSQERAAEGIAAAYWAVVP